MLVEFSVENCLSFKDEATFSLTATALKSPADAKHLDTQNVLKVGSCRILRSAAIYGANASGKSNLMSSMKLMRRLVMTSLQISSEESDLPVQPFLFDTSTQDAPSRMEAVFEVQGQVYRYGFTASRLGVVEEWLYSIRGKKEQRLFKRVGQSIELSSAYPEGVGFEGRIEARSLFISVVSALRGPIARQVVDWFKATRVISADVVDSHREYTLRCLQLGKNSGKIISILKALDLSIEDLEVVFSDEADVKFEIEVQGDFETNQELEKRRTEAARMRERFLESRKLRNSQVKTQHTVFDDSVPVGKAWLELDNDESKGTQKIFAIAGPIADTLAEGRTLFIDELDARIHPLVTKAIVGLFNDPVVNSNNAQLVFATHDTNLLNYRTLRRDQIWFVEKDGRGQSHLYSLAEIKVRQAGSFEADYIHGRYGAVPFIGDSRALLGSAAKL